MEDRRPIRCIGRTDDMLIYKGMNVYPSAIRDVLLSRFSGAVTPYMRILKQRKDQVRFDSPIAFEIERRPRARGIAARRRSCGYRDGSSQPAADSRRRHHRRARDHPAHRLQDRARPVG
jgi:hypothetical protein